MITIPLTEPVSPRYIYVNQKNNQVHLLMPIVSGTEIGLDNTCKSVYALQEFFDKSPRSEAGSALNELIKYQKSLEFDISLLINMPALREQKEERLHKLSTTLTSLIKIQNTTQLNTLSGVILKLPCIAKKTYAKYQSL